MSKKLSKQGGKKRSKTSPAKKAKRARSKTAPMTSPERRSPARKVHLAGEAPVWLAVPGRTSMIWRRADPDGSERKQQDFDTALKQPPFPLRLRDIDMDAFQNADAAGASAVTHFGPAKQDKTSNEDFALAATFVAGGHRYAFASLADGVSTKTFWPDRSSRLACLVAYRAFRRRAAEADALSSEWIDSIRHELGPRLQSAFQADRACLDGFVSPPGWSEGLYQRNRDVERYWYNTTLLAALVGETAGMILFSGDGGILVEKTYPGGRVVRTSLLEAGDDMAVFNTPSMDGEIVINGVRIDLSDGATAMRLMMFTDGVDRTLARSGDRWAWMSGPKEGRPGSRELHARLASLAASPASELDNMSVASLSWPLAPVRPGEAVAEPVTVQLDAGTRIAIERLSDIAQRWPRAVATLLLRAYDYDPMQAIDAASKLRERVNVPLAELAKTISLLSASPRDQAREEDDIRRLRSALKDI